MSTLSSIVRSVVITLVTTTGCGGGGSEAPDASSLPPVTDGGGKQEAAPTILAFEVAPSTLPYGGGTVTITWSVDGATAIELQGQPVTGPSAQRSVTSSTTFALRAHGPGGDATASASVSVATTFAMVGRVIDPRGAPLANVSVSILEGPPESAISQDDGSFRLELAGVAPPYTVCLYAPTTCYVGVTRADPTLVVWRDSVKPSASYSMTGALRRANSSPLPPLAVRTALDGPGNVFKNIIDSDTYETGLGTASGIELPRSRAWAVLQTDEVAEFGRSGEVDVIAGGTVAGQDITLSPVPTTLVTASYSGDFPSLQQFLIWGLILPHGGLLELGGQSAPAFRMPLVPDARVFVQAAAFAPQSSRKLSMITAVSDTINTAVSLAIPPVPVITSPLAGATLTSSTPVTWTALAGAVYRVRYTSSGTLDLIIASPTTTFPDLPLGLKTVSPDCNASACSVAIETYGGLATVDAATEGRALFDVKRGARSGSFSAGEPTQFSN